MVFAKEIYHVWFETTDSFDILIKIDEIHINFIAIYNSFNAFIYFFQAITNGDHHMMGAEEHYGMPGTSFGSYQVRFIYFRNVAVVALH